MAFPLSLLVLAGGGGLNLPDLVVDDGHDRESDDVQELQSEGH